MVNKRKNSIKIKIIKTLTVSIVGCIIGMLLIIILINLSSPDILIGMSIIGIPIISGIVTGFLIKESLADKVLYAIFAFVLNNFFNFLIFMLIVNLVGNALKNFNGHF